MKKDKKLYDKEYYLIHKDKKDAFSRSNSKKWKINNREKYLICTYSIIDKKKNLTCDLTVEWMKENITSKPCTYCGDTETIGCDRIDNTKGHTQDNCIPCCPECNLTRGNRFSIAEMIKIGMTIKQIKQDRLSRV